MSLTLANLYALAEQNNVMIDCYDFDLQTSMSVSIDGDCFIGINPIRLNTDIEEKINLAHELGHCMTGSFYNRYSKLDIRAKHEHRADKWAIKKLIPKDELKKAINGGRETLYELAEYFNVTESFMQKALDFYREG